jgi:ATP-binding cassette subfamily B protein
MIKLFRYLKPYTGAVIAVIILMFAQAMADLYLPTLMADIVNKGVIRNDMNFIIRTGILMTAVASAGILCAVASGFLNSKVVLGVSRKMRNELFTKISGFSMSEFNKVGAASLITRSTNDVMQVQQSLQQMMSIMVRAPIMCVGGIVMAFTRDAMLSLVFVVAIPLMAFVVIKVASIAIPMFREMQKKMDRLNMVTRENLSGSRVIRAFNNEENEKARFDKANKEMTSIAIKLANLMSIIMPILPLAMSLTMIAIVWFGGLRVESGKMQVGDIMAFIQYTTQILFSLMMLSMIFIMLPRAEASADRINELFELKSDINDPENPTVPVQKCSVEFRDVSYKYYGAQEAVISGISFKAGPGEITGIIGGTGAGKSTLINLIPRLYDAVSGSVIVDGVDVKDMQQDILRKKIGYIPQKAVLFSGTVASNIAFGSGNPPVEDIKKAAEISQSMEFINEMEGGFDHEITQGGTNLSGGQKQRLAIARAVLRRPEIYIFDDSFSALDFKTEASLRTALKNEISTATVFIVAQRVSTIMHADRIIVLDNGRIDSMGTHRELMGKSAIYREIVNSQLSESEAL